MKLFKKILATALSIIVLTAPINVFSLDDDEIAVVFTDSAFRAAINSADKDINSIITRGEMRALTYLDIHGRKINNLEGIQFAENLSHLEIYNNYITDISQLSHLNKLTSLDIAYNNITDIAPLTTLTSLTHLDITSNHIVDITPLAGMVDMTDLTIQDNSITDLSPLSGMASLRRIDIDSNYIESLAPLTSLNSLSMIYASLNFINSITSLVHLPNLTVVYLQMDLLDLSEGSQASKDIASLTAKNIYVVANGQRNPDEVIPVEIPDPNLRAALRKYATGNLMLTRGNLASISSNMDLSGLDITDLSGIEYLTNIYRIDLSDNNISDVSPLVHLTNIEWIDLSGNRISDISPFTDMISAALARLELTDNLITTIPPIAGLTALRILNLSNNQITDISGLAENMEIEWLSLQRNFLTDISPLINVQISQLDISYNMLDLSAGSSTMNYIGSNINKPNIRYIPQNLPDYNVLVNVPDPELLKAILSHIDDFNRDGALTRGEIRDLVFLNAKGKNIKDLTGLEYATNCSFFDLSLNPIASLNPIVGLPNIKSLNLNGTGIQDLSALSGLNTLTTLNLSGNAISDISILSVLTGLGELDLSKNLITDTSALSKLTKINTLNASDNKISNITFLTKMPSIRWLDFSGNCITDISVLSNFNNISFSYMDFSYNRITNIVPLHNMPFMTMGDIDISYNDISFDETSPNYETLFKLWYIEKTNICILPQNGAPTLLCIDLLTGDLLRNGATAPNPAFLYFHHDEDVTETLTYNGENVYIGSNYNLDRNGKYVLTIADKENNKTARSITVDTQSPYIIARGLDKVPISKGDYHKGPVYIEVYCDYIVMQTITRNGVEINWPTDDYFYQNGRYTITIKSKSGFTSTYQFTIGIECTITFNSMSGSAVPSATAVSDLTIVDPISPTRTGYTFVGWYKEAGCINVWNFTTDKVNGETTLYAKWKIKTFAVTFNSMNGSFVASKTANYNTSITLPTNPTRSGYTFVGWYTTSSYTSPWVFATNKVSSDITLYAKWIASPTAGLKVTSSGYNSILLTWTATSGASNYEIYRSTSSTGTYTLLSTQTTTSYTSTNLTTGTIYYYKVRAYALFGTTKIYNGYSSIVNTRAIPTTPTALKATSASYNSIKLMWTAVTGASGYGIYRSNSVAGTYTQLTTVTTAYYTNTNLTTGTTYYYKVAAYRLVGTIKVYGSQATAISAKAIPAMIATITASRASSTSIKISWGAISGASGYEVWRSTSSTGMHTLLKTQSALIFTNTGLKTGTTYYYKVRAYRMVGATKVYGGYSVVKFAKP